MKANAYVFAAVKEMQVVDDYTIRIVTSFPTPMDKIVGAGYGAFIMSPTMADKARNGSPPAAASAPDRTSTRALSRASG
jgi:hypothetical protein